MANAINSLSYGGSTYTFTLPYGTCSTAAATAAKAVTVDNFSLETGARVLVKFTITNTAADPTLNVNSTGAKPVFYKGAAISKGYLAANKVYEFVYNGTQWDLIGDVDTNSYAYARQYVTNSSTAKYPLLFKYDAGTATTTSYVTKYTRYANAIYAQPNGTLTASTFSGYLNGNAKSASSASKATTCTKAGTATYANVAASAAQAVGDSDGQAINSTYIKNATVSGQVVTFTKGDGSTFSITTQDTDTNTDTKNTAGATDSTSKLFLIGATTQTANPQTYSNSNVYISNGALHASTFGGYLNGTARYATTCTNAGTATYATNSGTATYAKSAATATRLKTSRTVRTNLGSTATASFNGTANITPGVTGTLPIGNGGTGGTTAETARENLGIEIGTWNPYVNCDDNGGINLGGNGYYVKVGDMVTITWFINTGCYSNTHADYFYIMGDQLPFTPDSSKRWYAGGGYQQGLSTYEPDTPNAYFSGWVLDTVNNNNIYARANIASLSGNVRTHSGAYMFAYGTTDSPVTVYAAGSLTYKIAS